MACLGWILSLAFASVAVTTAPGDVQVRDLVFVAPGGNAVKPVDNIDQSPSPVQTRIEWPSQDLYRRGQGGTVVLRLIIDDKGTPARVSIEESSGVDMLDFSAALAATNWRFSPAMRRGKAVASEARQPVNFDIPPEYSLARTTGRERDAWFEQRRAGGAPRPPITRQTGVPSFPGFVRDELPIGVDSVASARAMLERYAHKTADANAASVETYILRDEEGYSEWLLAPALPEGGALVVRGRLVGDAEASWMVQNILCEGPEERCAVLRTRLEKRAPAQTVGGPYPVPPGEAAGAGQ